MIAQVGPQRRRLREAFSEKPDAAERKPDMAILLWHPVDLSIGVEQ